MARIISIANQKGGVGKTTTSVNFSACLAAAKKKVLLVDLDPQGNATSGLGFDKDEISPTIYELLIGKCSVEEAIQPHPTLANLSMICSNIDLVGVYNDLSRDPKKYFRMKTFLTQIKEDYDFDYIVIDCPPSLGTLTVNSLIATDELIIPIQCEYYAMEGVSLILKTLKKIKAKVNTKIQLFGLLLTMYDGRTRLSAQVESEIRKHFKERVFETKIPRSVRLAEAPSHGKPIILYDIRSTGSVAYMQFTEEVLKRYEQ